MSDALRVHVIVGHSGRGADAGTWLACCSLERSHAVTVRDSLQAAADDFHAWVKRNQPGHSDLHAEIDARRASGTIIDAGFDYDEVGSWYEVCEVGEDPTVAAEHITGAPSRFHE